MLHRILILYAALTTLTLFASAKNIKWNVPSTVLNDVGFPTTITLSPLINGICILLTIYPLLIPILGTIPWATEVTYEVLEKGKVIGSGKLAPYVKTSEKKASIELKLANLNLKDYGGHVLSLELSSTLPKVCD
jgi:hypothetical protein